MLMSARRPASDFPRDDRRLLRNRWKFEEQTQWDFDRELPAHARQDPQREQGKPAEGEEVVVNADPISIEQLAPDVRQRVLDWRARRSERPTPAFWLPGCGIADP